MNKAIIACLFSGNLLAQDPPKKVKEDLKRRSSEVRDAYMDLQGYVERMSIKIYNLENRVKELELEKEDK